MGRKALTAVPPPQEPEILRATPDDLAQQEHDARNHRELIIAQWGDGVPYVREAYVAEIRRDMIRTVEAAIAIGRRLIVMRELEPHGAWLDCLRATGVQEDTAHRMMAAARRIDALPNSATSRNLTAAAGNQSKLFELLTLDQGDFAALADGDEAAGLTLDDVAKMTVKELRAALRDAREDLTAKDDRIKGKQDQLDAKDKQLRKLRKDLDKATPDEQLLALREACSRAALTVRADVSATGDYASLRTTIHELVAHDEGPAQLDFAAGLIGEILTELRKLRDAYDLPIVNDATGE